MPTQGDIEVRRRLRKLIALLLLIAVAAAGAMFLRACGPSPALLEQRAAEGAAWEKSQTAEQRASADVIGCLKFAEEQPHAQGGATDYFRSRH